MNLRNVLLLVSLLPLSAASLPGCAEPAPPTQATAETPATPGELPRIVVHKSPTCGCCNGWIAHLRESGFEVDARDEDDMRPVKARAGVPAGKHSCHTAFVAGYLIEGHVPAEDIKRLLAQRPGAKGLAVPGMPLGSPGMEMPDGRTQPYAVELVHRDGSTAVFARH